MGGRGASTNKQVPTNATFIENMNEAQLEREIAKYERRMKSTDRQIDAINNSGTVREMERIYEQYPGGVGGDAVTPHLRRLQERYGKALEKLGPLYEQRKNNANHLEALNTAYKEVKGTGLLVREARAKAKATGGKLGEKWVKGTDDARKYMYGSGTVTAYRNGDYKIVNAWQGWYLYNGNKEVGRFKTLAKAKEAASGRY